VTSPTVSALLGALLGMTFRIAVSPAALNTGLEAVRAGGREAVGGSNASSDRRPVNVTGAPLGAHARRAGAVDPAV
jgi:hypothetical protein